VQIPGNGFFRVEATIKPIGSWPSINSPSPRRSPWAASFSAGPSSRGFVTHAHWGKGFVGQVRGSDFVGKAEGLNFGVQMGTWW
jgi:hypothetical protein